MQNDEKKFKWQVIARNYAGDRFMRCLEKRMFLLLATVWFVAVLYNPVWALDKLAQSEDKPGATYSITPITRFSSDFRVTLSGLNDVGYFAVFRNGIKIGDYIPVSQGLRSMPQVFSDTGLLEIHFFKAAEGKEWLGSATLDGYNHLQFREGCFIATAAYGSKFQPAVVLLRHFRDRYLMNSNPGLWFVSVYYQYSPPLADFIADNSILRLLTRMALTPLVALVYLLFHPRTFWTILILVGIIIAWRLWLGKRKKIQLTLLLIPLLILSFVNTARSADISQVEDGYLRIGNDVYSLQSNSFTADRIAKSLAVLNQCYYKTGGRWYDVFAAEQEADLGDTTRALDNTVVNAWSNLRTWYQTGTAKDTFQVIPEAVTGVTAASISYNQIDLSWNPLANADAYEILRLSNEDAGYVKIAATNATNYSDTGLKEATAYCYKVRAVNDAGIGTESALASATTRVGANYYVNEAIKCYNAGDYNSAVSQASSAIAIDSECADAYVIRAGAYLKLDRDDHALADSNFALSIKPQHAKALVTRGWCYLKHGIFTTALDDFNSALGIDGTMSIAYKGRGICHAGLGKIIEALNDLNSFIRLQPGDPEAYFLRANIYYEKDEYQIAVIDHTRAIELDPQYARAYNNRGAAYNQLEQMQLSLVDFNQALQLDPGNACYYNNSGLAYYSLDQYQDALNRFNQAINLAPDYVAAYNNRAMAYLELGQSQLALNDWARAIQLNQSFTAAYLNRGFYYYENDQYPAAMTDFSQAISLASQEDPSDSFDPNQIMNFYLGGGLADAYFGRGCVFFEQDQYQNAISDYSQVIRLKPAQYHVYSWRGWAYLQLDQYDSAIADFTNHLTQGGDSASSYNGRAWCYFFKYRYNDAIFDFNNAIRINPQYANAYDGRGWSYYRLGQYALAYQNFRQCLALDPNNEDARNGIRAMGYYVPASLGEVQETVEETTPDSIDCHPLDSCQPEKAERRPEIIPVP